MGKMPFRGSKAAALIHFSLMGLLVLGSTSCLVRRRVVTRSGPPSQTLLAADKQTLIQKIAQQYNAIRTLNGIVDMVPAIGTANKGKITEYKDVRAYVLFRKPSEIRLIGLYPVVRNRAFDMVSDGARFRLYIPSKNRFIEGATEMVKPSTSKLENLRPQHFLEALLVRPIEPESEEIILENFTDEENAVYILIVLRRGGDGRPVLQRQLWFDRLKLQLVRQLIFDPSGDILTDARYSDWQAYDGVPFPKQIEINRPQDEYGVVMTVVKMDINKQVTDDKFVLEQPAGSQLQLLGETTPPPPPPAPVTKKGTTKK
jgi:hypothetical protein